MAVTRKACGGKPALSAPMAAVVIMTMFRGVISSKLLVYPFGHCLNSHLLNAEKFTEIVADGGHDVDLLVSTAYNRFEHHVDSSITKRWIQQQASSTPYESSSTNNNITGHWSSRQASVQLVQFEEPENYTPICEYDTLDFMLDASLGERFNRLFHTLVLYCDNLLQDRNLLNRLKANQYDLLVVESIDPCGRVLADFLDIPFIVLVTTGLGHFDSNPRPPSFLPAAISPFTSDMNFAQRVANVIMKVMYDNVIPTVIGFNKPFEELKKKYFLNTSISVENTFERASLRLVNSDFAVDYPAPIQPDTVLIGGFAVKGQPPPLPADVEEFVSESGEAGIIVVSFGTLVRRFSAERMKVLLETFSRLPQRVVWRTYDEHIKQVLNGTEKSNFTTDIRSYANIRLMRWLPQSSLLAHPKTRLFISHCGLNGMFEAAHYGVPMLALPLSGDQYQNAAKISGPRIGMGITSDIRTLTSEALYTNILHILTDDSYYKNAKRTSYILADNPFSPADRIRYWVDYVIRHNGAKHLRSESTYRFNWYQYWSLDVATFLLCVAITSIYIVFRALLLAGKLINRATMQISIKLKID